MVRFLVPPSIRAVATFAVLAAASTLRSENVWLQPESDRATPGAFLFFEIFTAAEFRGLSSALAADRLEQARVLLAGQPLTLAPWTAAPNALRSSVTLARPGIAVLDVLLKPEARSVARDTVESYLRETHADELVRAEWNRVEPPSPWQEVRTIRLKTYIRVGTPPPDDHAWADVTVKGLDMSPLSDPTAARVEAPFGIRVTRDGQPAAGVIVEFLSDGEAREHVTATDVAGRAAAPLNQRGLWLVRCFDVRRVRATNHDWETAVVALTVLAAE